MEAHLTALNFIKAVQPVADDLKATFRKKLAALLRDDLWLINRLCGYADGSLSREEQLTSLLVFGAVNILIAGEPCGMFSSEKDTYYYISHWANLDPNIRQNIKKSLQDTLRASLPDILKTKKFTHFKTPAAVRRMDARYDCDYYYSIITALFRYAQALASSDKDVSIKEESALKRIWTMLFTLPSDKKNSLTTNSSGKVPKNKKDLHQVADLEEKESEETLEDVLAELDSLIGLKNIKEEVHTLVNFLQVQKERTRRGLSNTRTSLHFVFYGPPGTGKTTVARLLSRIFKQMGLLEKGHLIETDRAGLVGAYVGHTSRKVDEKTSEALGGVLFIDEAYALKPRGDSGQDFGQEAIDILIKRMEDNRENLVVIAAGYPDEMKHFIESNPGLKSRFNRYLFFDHYSPGELLDIFKIMADNANYRLSDSAEKKLLALLSELHRNRDRSFGNGRLSRNLFEKIIEKQANRLAVMLNVSDEEIITIIEDDIPGPDLVKTDGDSSRTSQLPDWMLKRRKK